MLLRRHMRENRELRAKIKELQEEGDGHGSPEMPIESGSAGPRREGSSMIDQEPEEPNDNGDELVMKSPGAESFTGRSSKSTPLNTPGPSTGKGGAGPTEPEEESAKRIFSLLNEHLPASGPEEAGRTVANVPEERATAFRSPPKRLCDMGQMELSEFVEDLRKRLRKVEEERDSLRGKLEAEEDVRGRWLATALSERERNYANEAKSREEAENKARALELQASRRESILADLDARNDELRQRNEQLEMELKEAKAMPFRWRAQVMHVLRSLLGFLLLSLVVSCVDEKAIRSAEHFLTSLRGPPLRTPT